jgi:hypothetical protein
VSRNVSTPVRVTLLPDPESDPITSDGPVRSIQEAELAVPVEIYRKLWKVEYLERLARAYWAHLSRISLGLIRVVYAPDSRTVVLLSHRLPLLRFHRPQYAASPAGGEVVWQIERGLLVARAGRGSGMLRIAVSSDEPEGDTANVTVRTEVANFYPFIRGSGAFARFGTRLYSATQLRIHVWVTKGFLRSLERLDLPPSPVGALTNKR